MDSGLLKIESLSVNIYGKEILRNISMEIKEQNQNNFYYQQRYNSFDAEVMMTVSEAISAGIQRLILLGRAMIKTPPLLILDEPCQDPDPAQTSFTLQTIDRHCAFFRASLIFVSHYQEDFPVSIRQVLRLEKGKTV